MFWMNNVVIWYQKVEEWINESNKDLLRLSFIKGRNYTFYNIHQKNEKYQIVHVCGMHPFLSCVW